VQADRDTPLDVLRDLEIRGEQIGRAGGQDCQRGIRSGDGV